MEFNFITNVQNCYVDIPSILYYSHIPTAAAAVLITFYVFLKDKKSLASRILFFMALLFSFWSLMDIELWRTYDSRVSIFVWSLINLVEMLVSVTTLYFAYVFIERKDASLKVKILAATLLSFFIILIPTRMNLKGFRGDVCEGDQGPLTYYFYFLEAFFSIWLLIFLLHRIKKYWRSEERKKIIYFSVGIIAFLFSFSGANILGSALTALNVNILGGSNENWKILQYGLFGMPIFLGFLAYLIVKFKAFNIKLLASQALVFALVILVGSQFFYVQNPTSRVLTAITLVISMVFGAALIRSVKLEVQRKEELQDMSDKLAVANSQLVKLDNAKSEFISIASHQLRTPLTAIKGFVSLLLEGTYGKIETKVRDALNKVYLSNERMVGLVENLLNISRIESGRMEYQFSKIKVEDVLHELYDTFAITAKNKGLALEFKLPESPLPQVEMDGPKAKEIISNLIDNAIKYTDKGSVTVSAQPVGEFIQVTIADTGIGIPEGELPYLFDKFSRGRDTNRLHVTGTGLGLYVGKQMIDAQNGRLRAESEGVGKGSRFIVELPLSQKNKSQM